MAAWRSHAVGRGSAPPAGLRAAPLADGGVAVTWRRRSRSGWRWSDGGDVPLAEEQERYRVTLTSGVGVRTVVVDVPAVTIGAAERGAGAVTVEVVQLGNHAASPAATLTVAA